MADSLKGMVTNMITSTLLRAARKRFLPLVLTLLFIAHSPALAIRLPENGESLAGQIVILHTNDTHGRIDENMGFSSVAALKELYEASGAAVILLDAGDTLQGRPVLNHTRGEDAVMLLNAVGYDAMAIGNHDLSYGDERLNELADEMDFLLLSANVVYSDTGELLAQANTVIEKNGKKLGIFGLTTQETAFKCDPSAISALDFPDPIETAKAQAAALKAGGADYIIALCHIGLDESSEITSDMIAEAVPEIDILIDGHSHTELQDGMQVGDTLICSSGEYLNNIGVVTISADGDISAGLVDAGQFSGKSEKIDALITDINLRLSLTLDAVIASSAVSLLSEGSNIAETGLGNLAADAMRARTGADAAMLCGGELNADIPAGSITKGQVLSALPNTNNLVVKRVTGAQILEALEHGLSKYPDESAAFPQVSGITLEFDVGAEPGSRIVSAKMSDKPLDPKAWYTLALSDFLASGSGGFDMLAAAETLSEYSSPAEIVIDFLTANPGYAAQAAGRISVLEADKENRRSYVVRAGDSLWKIALELWGDGTRWTDIYALNSIENNNPNLIYPGQRLFLPA